MLGEQLLRSVERGHGVHARSVRLLMVRPRTSRPSQLRIAILALASAPFLTAACTAASPKCVCTPGDACGADTPFLVAEARREEAIAPPPKTAVDDTPK